MTSDVEIAIRFLLKTSYYILVITSILWLIYLAIVPISRLIFNKNADKKLNIKTTGVRGWEGHKLYHRTESTPYLALKSIVKKCEFSKEDHLVDFGCGKGRVAIFFNKTLSIPVTGIELNDLTFEELKMNVENSGSDSISLKKEKAEEYKIAKSENKFFFFNPFNSKIFEKVLKNIVKDAVENKKYVEIILYYPTKSYRKVLEKDGHFKLDSKFTPPASIGPTEKVFIYKFNNKD